MAQLNYLSGVNSPFYQKYSASGFQQSSTNESDNRSKNQPVQQNNRGYVAVVDGYKAEPDKDYDNDNIADKISHGEIVSSLIDDHDVVKVNDEGKLFSNILKDIRQRVEKGDKISAVNYSAGIPVPYDLLSAGLEKQVTPENIREHVPEIIEGIRKESESYPEAKVTLEKSKGRLQKQLDSLDITKIEHRAVADKLTGLIEDIDGQMSQMDVLKEAVDVYDEINKLADICVPVVISSGNSGNSNGMPDTTVNILTLNEKAITIGATDPLSDESNSKKAFFSNDNSLVDAKFTGVFFNQWLDPSISSKLSGTNSDTPHHGIVNGTSFSAPIAADIAASLKEGGASVERINDIFNRSESYSNMNAINNETILNTYMNSDLIPQN